MRPSSSSSPRRDRGARHRGTIAPSLLAFTVFAVVRTNALEAFFPPQPVPTIDNPLVVEHGVRYFATALGLIARYARIVFVPFGLANDYSGASIPMERSFLAWRPMLGIAILGALGFTATRGRAAAVFVAITVLPYLLVSNLLVPVGAIFAERFLYLPVAGLGLLASLVIAKLGARGRIAVLAVITVLGVAMFARSLDWKDDATIFAETARNNPRSPRAPYWLGNNDGAIANGRRSPDPGTQRGSRSRRRRRPRGRGAAMRESLRWEPSRAEPRLDLGIVLHRRGALEPRSGGAEGGSSRSRGPSRLRGAGPPALRARRMAEAAEAYRRAVLLGRTDLLPRLRELERVRSPLSHSPVRMTQWRPDPFIPLRGSVPPA